MTRKKPEKTFMVAVRINKRFCSVFTFQNEKDKNDFLFVLREDRIKMEIEWSVPVGDDTEDD